MSTNGRIPPRQIDATGTRDNTTFLRGDGVWVAPAGSLSYGTTAELADVTAAAESAGASALVARADHKHGVATAAPVALTGSTQAVGTSTSLARADHQHGIPTGIPQANVTNLVTDLAGKAATSHTHTKANITDFAHTHPATDITTGLTIAQTTGLQAALDGKAAVEHTHTVAEITDLAAKYGAARVRVRPSADQLIPHATFTTISHGTEVYDSAALHSTTVAPERITFDRAGLWLVHASAVWGAESAVGRRITIATRYSAADVPLGEIARATNFPNMAQTLDSSLASPVQVGAAGEYVSLRVYQDSGVSVTLTAPITYFAATFLGE